MKEKILHYYDKNKKNSTLCNIPGLKEATILKEDITCSKCRKLLKSKKQLKKQLKSVEKIEDDSIEIKLDFNNKLLKRLLLHYKYRNVSIKEAIDFITEKYSFSKKFISDIKFKEVIIPNLVNNFIPEKYYSNWYKGGRKYEVILIQQALMYIVFIEKFGGNRSLSETGSLIRNKDHATVLHACKAVKNSSKYNPRLYNTYLKLKKYLKQNYD